MVHAPDDDAIPYDNALSAKAAFDAMGASQLVRIVDVSPVSVLAEKVGTHLAAGPADGRRAHDDALRRLVLRSRFN